MHLVFRQLLKSPGFTAVAVLTLALGIGANTAIFSIVHAVLLRPLPYPQPERLVAIWEIQPNHAVAPMSWPSLQDYRRDNETFAAIGGYRWTSHTLTNAGEPEVVSGAQVDASFFAVIGLAPQLGRTFTESEDRPGAPKLAVLSDGLWRRQFGSNPAVLGHDITLNGELFTIIGVMPTAFGLPADADVFTSLGAVATALRGAHGVNRSITAIGRLKRSVTLEQARADLRRISTRIEQDDPQFSTGISAGAELLFDRLVGSYRRGLWTLLGAAALVLLVACTNLSNLLLARGSARAGEIAVRSALGATRAALMRPLLLESAVLAGAGGLLGVLLATWMHDGIVALAPGGIPRLQEARIDGAVLGTAALISAATVVLFGLWPAWRAAQTDFRGVAMQGGRGNSDGRAAIRRRELLIVAEVAITLVLLVGAGLLFKSLARARATDLGFNPEQVLTARLTLPARSYPTPEKTSAFFAQLLERLAAQPGVETVALASTPPLIGANRSWQNRYAITGQPAPRPGQEFLAEVNAISDDYFRTLAIPVVQGRSFRATDTGETARVAIVDHAFAELHWPGRNPLGQRIHWNSAPERPLTIVGIVPSLRLHGYSVAAGPPQVYVPLSQESERRVTLLIRTGPNPANFTGVLRQTVHGLDPNLAVAEVGTFDARVASTFGTPRLYTFLLSTFAGLAVLLAALGFYGVLAYQVSRRRREFGIRLALGAVAGQLISQVVRGGLRLVAIGAAAGLIGAIFVGRALRSLLYETEPFDSAVFLAAITIFLVIALLASWFPARRAAHTDPLSALRTE